MIGVEDNRRVIGTPTAVNVAKPTPVAAAASVPFSSTSMNALWTTESISSGLVLMPEKLAA